MLGHRPMVLGVRCRRVLLYDQWFQPVLLHMATTQGESTSTVSDEKAIMIYMKVSAVFSQFQLSNQHVRHCLVCSWVIRLSHDRKVAVSLVGRES